MAAYLAVSYTAFQVLDHLVARTRNTLPALFAGLNARMREREDRIGPRYLLRKKNLTANDLAAIWTENLLPLLEERHLGTGVDVASRFALNSLLSALQLGSAVDAVLATDDSAAPEAI